MTKMIIVILTIMLGLSSCNKEVVKLKGKFKDVNKSDFHLVVKMKSRTHIKEQILDTIDVRDGEFEFYSNVIKPPVKLTFTTPDSIGFDVWAGEYGTKTLEINKDSLYDVKVLGSFFCDELQRMNKNLNQMYIHPIKEKELELDKLSEMNELSNEEEVHLAKLKKDIKKAYRLRKKSILKTVRKNTQNPVAVALMCQEYERLTPHQKKECLKYINRSFSDTGLNWQMKN